MRVGTIGVNGTHTFSERSTTPRRTTDSVGLDLRSASSSSMDARSNLLHLIFAVQLHFLELYFFNEVF
jgi:hypothetical protein